MRKIILRFTYLGIILSLALSACGSPAQTKPAADTAVAPTVPPATEVSSPPSEPAPTPVPTEITHTLIPGDMPGGILVYDSESYSTASLKYAGNGDVFQLNRFERPFTFKDMGYLPNIDIQSFNISRDDKWFFVAVELADLSTSIQGYEPSFGVEIDYDFDGRGDFLLWATPPLDKNWSVKNLKVFEDANHDVGGKRPDQADGNPGDGYEKLIFDGGQGEDPDLAWVRVDPINPNFIQFAFKQSLKPGNPENGFEAAIWADASNLKDPAKFAYNDLMTIESAGSPLKGDINYPIKEMYAVDSTCYKNFLSPTGYAPLLCSASEEKVKRPPREKPGGPPPVCIPSPNGAPCP